MISRGWTKEETDVLWELCERFDLRFIVVFDRYDEKYNRTMEDLKARYYSVSKKLLQVRGVQNHPILNFEYNPDYDRRRKYELEKFLLRSRDQNEKEKLFLKNIKKIDQDIKKEEKEQENLKRLLKQGGVNIHASDD